MPLSNLKASYVRPFSENKENIKPIQVKKIAEKTASDEFYDSQTSVIHPPEETKDCYLNVVNLVHSKLFANVEEIRKWKTSIEIESEQKNKKEGELLTTIESQRKQLLDFQLQNENLNIQLNEEIQQRTLVLEKLHSTKELCSALKKHYNTLQGHYEYGNRIEEIINVTDAKRLKAIENLKIKFEKINSDYSESVEYLKNALRDEESKVIDLRETFEIRLLETEKENKSLSVMLQNCQSDVNRLNKEVEDEKNKSKFLLKEKNNLEANLLQLQESNKELACQLHDTENTLKLVESNKIEIEKRYLSDNNEIRELKKKYEESIERSKCLKTEYEDTLMNLKQTLASSESKALDIEIKFKEEHLKCKELTQSLQDTELKRSELEYFASDAKEHLMAYEVLKSDFIAKEQQINQMSEENKYLKNNLEAKHEEVSKCLSEKESLALLYNQKDEELLSLIEKQKNLELSSEKEMLQLRDTVSELQSKLKVLEEDLITKTEFITSKEKEVSSLQFVLNEKEVTIGKLSHENDVMKETVEKEKNNAMNCKECRELKEQLENLRNLKDALKQAEQELKNEKKENAEHWKILSYTESRFNETRVTQEKEIIQLQSEIRKLKDKLDVTEVNLESLNTLQAENTNLKEEIENLKSHSFKEEDFSKQLSENKDLKEESKRLSLKISSLNKEMKKLKSENTSLKKISEKVEKYSEDLKSLISENTNLKEETKQLKLTKNKELKKLTSENLSLKENFENLENNKNEDVKTLETENLCLKEEIKKLETIKNKELEELMTENSNLKKNNEKLENIHSENLKALQSENLKLKEDTKELKSITEKYLAGENSDTDEEVEPLKKKRKISNKKSKVSQSKIPSPKVKDSVSNQNDLVTKKKSPGPMYTQGKFEKNDLVTKKKSPGPVYTQGKFEKVHKMSTLSKETIVTSPKQGNSKPSNNLSVYDKWETNSSSGSEVFEFVFDQGIKGKVTGLSRKKSTQDSSFKSLSQSSPFVGGTPRTPMQEVEVKRKSVTSVKSYTKGITRKEASSSENLGFLQKENEKKENNLWFQLKNPPRASPVLPSTPRKFFKTPLSDREVFKKPDGKASPWF